MSELYSKQPGFTYGACGPFTIHCKRILKFRETRNLKYVYRNELDKACFAHDDRYSSCKDLAKRTISDKTLKDRDYEIARNCKHDGYQRELASMVYKIFHKETGSAVSVNEKISIIKKNKKRQVYARFKDNIGAEYLAERKSLSSKNKKVKSLLCVADIFTKFV